jgi:hypothetical protein
MRQNRGDGAVCRRIDVPDRHLAVGIEAQRAGAVIA